MKIILLFTSLSFFLLPDLSFCQNVGIGITAPHISAELDISSTARGLLIPRMTSTGITAISTPAKGLMVYDSLNNQLMVNMGTPAAPNWQTIVLNSGWSLSGNSGTNPASQFIGNTDNQPLQFRVNNTKVGELNPATGNIFWGLRAGQANTTAYSNIAIGTDALRSNQTGTGMVAIGDSALFSNGVNALDNTAVGWKSLYANVSGRYNTALGYQSLYSNLGSYNTATGTAALYSNASGSYNTANGEASLSANTGGSYNVAVGMGALTENTNGSHNTALGYASMSINTTGASNVAVGEQSLYFNDGGSFNVATGLASLYFNTSGSHNIATGWGALHSNEEGNYNIAIGDNAMYYNEGALGSNNIGIGASVLQATTNSQFNTVVGHNSAVSYDLGYNNTILGANCSIQGNGLYNCIAIGQAVTCTASSQARIGNLATNSIGGTVGWSTLSDGRYKMDLQENVKGIDFIMKLRPLTYHLNLTALNNKLNGMAGRKNNIQDAGTRQALAQKESAIFSGFIAQEVEQAAAASGYAFSGVDKPQNENDLYGLRYAEFVVPLVKAVQEQQLMIIDLQKQINELKAMVKNK